MDTTKVPRGGFGKLRIADSAVHVQEEVQIGCEDDGRTETSHSRLGKLVIADSAVIAPEEKQMELEYDGKMEAPRSRMGKVRTTDSAVHKPEETQMEWEDDDRTEAPLSRMGKLRIANRAMHAQTERKIEVFTRASAARSTQSVGERRMVTVAERQRVIELSKWASLTTMFGTLTVQHMGGALAGGTGNETAPQEYLGREDEVVKGLSDEEVHEVRLRRRPRLPARRNRPGGLYTTATQ